MHIGMVALCLVDFSSTAIPTCTWCNCLLADFERTRTPLTSFIHSFQFSMMFFSSTMLKPVSFCSWSTYVNASLPLFLAPCFGSQSGRSLITSSFFLQQCPINRSLLIISVSVILGRLPYSSLLVLCSFQETPRTASFKCQYFVFKQNIDIFSNC